MIKEIKQIKLNELTQDNIDSEYNNELFRKRKKLNLVMKSKETQGISWDDEISSLEQELVDMQKVSKEEWIKNKIINAKTLKEHETSFEDAIKMLNEKNIPIVLTEEDKVITNNESSFKDMSDLMFVHKTRYFPKNGVIRTSKNSGAYQNMSIDLEIDGKDYKIGGNIERDTIHFSLNTEVEMNGGGMLATLIDEKNNWEYMKYTILIPGKDINKDQLISLRGEDSYFKGNLNLPSEAIVLVPENERETLQKGNPNIQLIGYVGDPKNYGTALLSSMGYKAEKIDPNSKKRWSNEEDTNKVYEIAKENNISTLEHWDSREINEEHRGFEINCLLNIFLIIKDKIKENPNFINNIHNEQALLYRIQSLFLGGVMVGKENAYNQNELEEEGIEQLLEKCSKNGIKFSDDHIKYMKENFTRMEYQKIIEQNGISMARELFVNNFIGQLIYALEQNIAKENEEIATVSKESINKDAIDTKDNLNISDEIQQLRMKVNQIQNKYHIMLADGHIDDNELADLSEILNVVINEAYSMKEVAINSQDLNIISTIIDCLEEEQNKIKSNEIESPKRKF